MTGSATDHSTRSTGTIRSTMTHLGLTAASIATLFAIAAPAPAAAAHTLHQVLANRHDVVTRVERQIGTRYRYGGSSPRGFDCSGLTRWAYRAVGARLPHNSSAQFRLGHRQNDQRIWKRTRLRRGDLVFFHTYAGRRVTHVGLYVGHGKFVSATNHGVRKASVWDRYYWGRKYVGATRLPAMMKGRLRLRG